MIPFATLCLAFLAQEAAQLEVGQVLVGEVAEECAEVHSLHLDANYSDVPVIGMAYRLVVSEAGFYYIDLRSFDFDAYLILADSKNGNLAEDDDGLMGTHARVVMELEADREYRVQACALHGARGIFNLEVRPGRPTVLSKEEKWIAEETDWKSRIAHIKETLGVETFEYAAAINRLGLHYYRHGDYAKTRLEWESALEIFERVSGPEHPNTGDTLNNLALLLQAQGELEEAGRLFQRALDVLEKVHGLEHSSTAVAVDNLGKLFYAQGKYGRSRPLFERALAIREKVLGSNHASTAASLNNLAFVLKALGEFQEVGALYERALAIREEVLGPEHPVTAESLINLASLLQSQGGFEKARPLYERALAIHQKVLGPDHRETALSLASLANLLLAQGNYDAARLMFERSLSIREKVLGPMHADTADSLNHLAVLLHAQGDYQQARPLFERSLEIRTKVFGQEHPRTADSLSNLALLLRAQGNHQEARPLCERALAIRENRLGKEHPSTALSLNNLASLLNDQGNFGEARPLYERALEIRERVLGPVHPDTAVSLSNLAVFFHEQGFLEEARPMAQRALEIREKILGPDHPETSNSLNNLAYLLLAQGLKEEARPLFERALDISERVLGPEHLETANRLGNLAGFLQLQGNFEESRPLHERAMAIRRKVLGSDHPSTTLVMTNLAHLLFGQGDFEEALPLYRQAMTGSFAYLDRELPTLSEAERLQLLELSASPEGLLHCLGKMERTHLRDSYSLFQTWKGKATRYKTASIQINRAANSTESQMTAGRIQELAKELSRLILLPLAEQADDHVEQVVSLRAERLRLEREQNRDLGLNSILATPALDAVQAGMPEGTVLLDFFVGDEVYAWILTFTGEPKLVHLGSGPLLRATQEEALRRVALRGGRTLSEEGRDSNADLFDILWAPLRDVIGNASTVFVSPDGFLCELPLGILQEVDGSFLLEKYRFVYLSDPTLLSEESVDSPYVEGPLLAVGSIDYFRRDAPAEISASVSSTRSRIGSSWTSLPATKVELQHLRDLHDRVLHWKSRMTIVENQAATEERVRSELPGNRYVHIATHGYFEPDHLPSLVLDAEEMQSKVNLGKQIQTAGMLPGLLSGLVFAGVNGDPDLTRDDGYLSAEEILHLDLSACDLVVLSACETALGSARAGEGLMSLRRAFSVAGADTVLSSLWKVEDQATARLMKDFYTNLWQEGMSRSEALHQAKLRTLRRNRIEHEGDAMPMTWGAFVLSGQWD